MPPPDAFPRPFRVHAARRLRPRWRAAAAIPALFLSGCLYSTHHFNTGRLLEPGRTAVTLGMGRAFSYRLDCPEGYRWSWTEADGDICRYGAFDRFPPNPADTVVPFATLRDTLPKASIAYRLGVRGKWGPLTGVEIGWALEAPTNPATLEFDLKAGLPAPAGWRLSHALTAGWGIGAWADNTWFLEYAVSRAFSRSALFASYRHSRLATQPDDMDSSSDAGRFIPIPGRTHQYVLGWRQALPLLPVLPDYLLAEFTWTSPLYRAARSRLRPPDHDLNLNLGFEWGF